MQCEVGRYLRRPRNELLSQTLNDENSKKTVTLNPAGGETKRLHGEMAVSMQAKKKSELGWKRKNDVHELDSIIHM
jgi:hypothetical protein